MAASARAALARAWCSALSARLMPWAKRASSISDRALDEAASTASTSPNQRSKSFASCSLRLRASSWVFPGMDEL